MTEASGPENLTGVPGSVTIADLARICDGATLKLDDSCWPRVEAAAAVVARASGATWVSLHHGGGVGIGYSQHAGSSACCGTIRRAA